MDFTLPDEAAQAADLAATILADAAGAGDTTGAGDTADTTETADTTDLGLWKALGAAGLLGLLGADLLDPADTGDADDLDERQAVIVTAAVIAQIGRAVAAVPLAAHAAALLALRRAAGRRDLPDGGPPPSPVESLLQSASAAEVILTLGLRCDPADPVRLVGSGTGLSLQGRVLEVRSAPAADAIVIAATDDTGTERLVLVTRGQVGDDAFGVSRTSDDSTRTSITLDGIDVPAHALLGGAEQTRLVRALATAFDCIHQSGVLDEAIRRTAAYVSTREQFGRPIGSFQAVGQRLADGYVDARAARLTAWQAISLVADALADGTLDESSERAVATAAFWAADAGHRVAQTTVHLHGGMGIDLDAPAHRYFLAAKLGEFGLGGATRWAIAAGRPGNRPGSRPSD